MKKILKNTIALTLLLAFSLTANAQEGRLYTENHENGVLWRTGTLMPGNKPDGKWKLYTETGSLDQLILYNNGEAIKLTTFYPNGNAKRVQKYHEGKMIYKTDYYDNGGKKREIGYANDKATGITKSYYNNGKLNAIGSYLNGELNGEWKHFHDWGELFYIRNYKDGKKEGAEITYDALGVSEIGNYTKDKKNGVWKTYSGDKLIKTEEYVDGELTNTTEHK